MKNRAFWILSIVPLILVILISIPFSLLDLIKGKTLCAAEDKLIDMWISKVIQALNGGH